MFQEENWFRVDQERMRQIELVSRFTEALERARSGMDDRFEIGPITELKLAKLGDVEFNPEPKRNILSDEYISLDGRIVVKLMKARCGDCLRELIALALLKGLSGFAPKMFPIVSGLPAGVEQRAIAMEFVGDSNWSDEVKSFDRSFFVRFARLLEAVRSLHALGFVHLDIVGENIRVKREYDSFLALIGYKYVCPLIDSKTMEYDEFYCRRSDMAAIAYLLRKIGTKTPDWVHEFDNETISLEFDQRPDYEKWIKFAMEQARQL